MLDVFLAYATPDEDLAKDLYDILSAVRLNVFMAPKNLRLGDDWFESISENQRDSLLTIILLSHHTSKAHFQKEEILKALKLQERGVHRVIPVYISGKQIPENLPVPIRGLQALFLDNFPSLLGVAQRIEAEVLTSRRRIVPVQQLEERTIVIVTGCHHRPEYFDRPLAERLRDKISREGEVAANDFMCSVILGDLWFLDHSGISGHPNVISIGSVAVNRLTGIITGSSGVASIRSEEDRWQIVKDRNRWAVFGGRAQDTRAAVKAFRKFDLEACLKEAWK